MPTTETQRAYAVTNWKAIDGEKRIIEGIASTPTPDRVHDVVELDGIEFKLPLPLLYQHDRHQPIGHVISAKKTKGGLLIKAQIAPSGIVGWIDEAWALIKAGLVRGLSIGFRAIEESFDQKSGGYRYLKTEWLELSAVTIPANAEANILTVKSADQSLRAALGTSARAVTIQDAFPTSTTVGVTTPTKGKAMTVKEQIAALEAKRAASDARMEELLKKTAEEGRTFDDVEKDEYDALELEVKSCDDHLVRLKERERRMVATATAVHATGAAAVMSPEKAAETRRGVVTVTTNTPKGIGVARMAIAMVKSAMTHESAEVIAKRMWPDMPEVAMYIKAAVDAGDTTTSGWASQLVPAARAMPDEFLEMLRPQTILGRIPGVRNVPFNIAVPAQTGGGSYTWVGEAIAKPVTSLTFTSLSLRWAKAAGIIVITQELAKFSSPSAEVIVRDQMIKGVAQFLDEQFVSTNAEVSNVSPAGILNGITAIPASGVTGNHLRIDLANLLDNFTANNIDPASIVLLMSSTNAMRLSLLITDLGVRLFPDINLRGGTLLAIPVIASETVGNKIIGLNASDILMAEDGPITVDVSTQASVEMSTTPIVGDTSPITGAVLKSLWQNNLVGFRVEKYITWKRGRDSAVEYISNAAYAPSL